MNLEDFVNAMLKQEEWKKNEKKRQERLKQRKEETIYMSHMYNVYKRNDKK